MAQQLAKKAENIIVSEGLSLRQLKELISTVSLVIGGDTGPTHLAWAMNIPSITIFGPTPGYRNMFETNINYMVESTSKVDPYNINKNDYSMKNIDPKEIITLSRKLLKIRS